MCRADALFGNGSDKLLLVTNSHVVNAEGGEGALRFDKAAVRFEVSGHISRCTSIVWSSPVKECDVTVLELDSLPPKVAGLSLSDEPLTMPLPSERARRLYIIGYAGGRGPFLLLRRQRHDRVQRLPRALSDTDRRGKLRQSGVQRRRLGRRRAASCR